MATLLQISLEVNSGSVGRIAEQIGQVAIAHEWDSYITYARNHLPSHSKTIKIGTKSDIYWHGIMTRLFDSHCLHSTRATKKLIKQIEKIKPDIIQLHHIHGYFLNMQVLFNYLSSISTPVVWVFHDCWAFTGHCPHFEYVKCDKWLTQCTNCIQKKVYPKSIFKDRSFKNYTLKKLLFTSVSNLTIVPVSQWLENIVKKSFLQNLPIMTIQNGIDLNIFSPQSSQITYAVRNKLGLTKNSFILLGVASTWEQRKGLDDFFQLYNIIPKVWTIILVGLSKTQVKKLPNGIIGIERTENVAQLAALYSMAAVFINPTWEDTFPTTNLESLACGTPVITYRTGGSVESISEETGYIVEKGNVDAIKKCIVEIEKKGKKAYSDRCRERAIKYYNKDERFEDYMKLYNNLLKQKNG